ncbi:hypothetical protein EB796_015567 [Bugula neritina]|uniref:Uncharacterized protein n=1 Tax=Bugula neritina TaxID=10212 RepID=A0A7J7JIH0_BUGNE|nr:hypothetical protein EB796_015567 [Bugula neritina]
MQELDSCQQLFLLEPDNKWVLLTIIWLMKSIDPIKFKNEIMSNLKQLEDVDSLRRNYYSDLRSKFIWEEVITELSTPQVDMSGQHLTRCYNAHLLYAVTELNLSNNDLINADGLNHLQKLVTLILSNNKIVCCRGLINMPCLKHLDLQNNCIKSKTDLERVQQTCSALQELLTDGNPLDTLN